MDSLARRGTSVTLELPHRNGKLAQEGWPDDALVVHRGLSRDCLEQLAGEERRGRELCNSAAASLLVLNRPSLSPLLEDMKIPVAGSLVVADWAACKAEAERIHGVIKSVDGAAGRGGSVLFAGSARLSEVPPFAGPYHVEERIRHDGIDRKLYVAGDAVFGLSKRWPRTAGSVRAFDPPERLRQLALAVGRATRLEIYGVDVVIGEHGPVVVDVNVFPGFRGVAGAGAAVAQHVMRRIRKDV
jgi:ribosomal protein S6--L-glutamate ligase